VFSGPYVCTDIANWHALCLVLIQFHLLLQKIIITIISLYDFVLVVPQKALAGMAWAGN
jgi:hypothetical protein